MYPGIIAIAAAVAIFIFISMRNKQSDRNAARRERLKEKQEELMDMLSKKKNDQL